MNPDDDIPAVHMKRLKEMKAKLERELNPAMKPFVNRVSEFIRIDKSDEPGTRVMLFATRPNKTKILGDFAGILIEGNGVLLIGSVHEEGFSVAVEQDSMVLETSLHLRGTAPDGTEWYLRHVILTDAERDEMFAIAAANNDPIN